MTDDEPIQAAGGVVWRSSAPEGSADGGIEILLIHRPRYDDWTLPKGKAEPDDADAAATALREVWEETGLRCRLGADLGEIGYTVRGRPKVVRYWAMAIDVPGPDFAPNDEVDQVAWMAPGEARRRLQYEHDHEIVDRFLASWL
jgi:8-oxo-dGTP diphosphatase